MGTVVVGHEPVESPLNVANEVRQLRRDPLAGLLDLLDDTDAQYLHGDVGRYLQAYEFYCLSGERYLRHISVGSRYQREVRSRSGGRRKLTERQKRISREYHDRAPYFRLDLVNVVVHGRVLLDRTITFSRRFLRGEKLPSFASFAEHKKFFKKFPDALPRRHAPYANYIGTNTDWFDISIKAFRDRFLIHSGPAHFQFLTYPNYHDLGMLLVLDRRRPWTEHPEANFLRISVRRLLADIASFLTWYNDYAIRALTAHARSPRGN